MLVPQPLSFEAKQSRKRLGRLQLWEVLLLHPNVLIVAKRILIIGQLFDVLFL